jgi:hypothetical protein
MVKDILPSQKYSSVELFLKKCEVLQSRVMLLLIITVQLFIWCSCHSSNTTGATSGAGTAYPCGEPELPLPPVFIGVGFVQSLVFWSV